MKKTFVKTNNVKNFISMMNNLQNRAEGVPGLGLVYGEPGLGKTYTIMWWAMQNSSIYIRCANNMNARWLLEEIVEEFNEIPHLRYSDLYNQTVKCLIERPKIILVDEVDYLTEEYKAVETLRDLHDKTNIPIVLIGMENADKKLLRYKHLYDRISEKCEFKSFNESDVAGIISELSDIPITDCGKKFIFTKTNRFRQIVKFLNKIEQIGKSNGLNSIDELTIKEFIEDDEIINSATRAY